jgi:hypothetical protein
MERVRAFRATTARNRSAAPPGQHSRDRALPDRAEQIRSRARRASQRAPSRQRRYVIPQSLPLPCTMRVKPIKGRRCASQQNCPPMTLMGQTRLSVPSAERLICPRQRTLCGDPGASESCQYQTHALQQTVTLFDHLICAGEYALWHREAERVGGLEIYHQLDLRGLLNWQIGRFLAFENAAHVNARKSI